MPATFPSFEVVDLGIPPGEARASPLSINNQGMVVGRVTTHEGLYRAFQWKAGIFQELKGLGARLSSAVAISDSEVIVGFGYLAEGGAGGNQAFMWRGGEPLRLEMPEGGRSSMALAVNDQGHAAGFYYDAATTPQAILWDDRGMHLLSGAAKTGVATGINARGQVIGVVASERGEDLAVLWHEGQLTELGTLPGARSSYPTAINERGQVVGRSGGRSFIWESGVMTPLLTTPPGGGEPTGINDASQVFSEAEDGQPYLWQAGEWRFIRDLVSSSDPLREMTASARVFAMNDRSQVAGFSNTHQRGFLLHPLS